MIKDAAEGFGSRYNGQMLGTLGAACVYGCCGHRGQTSVEADAQTACEVYRGYHQERDRVTLKTLWNCQGDEEDVME